MIMTEVLKTPNKVDAETIRRLQQEVMPSVVAKSPEHETQGEGVLSLELPFDDATTFFVYLDADGVCRRIDQRVGSNMDYWRRKYQFTESDVEVSEVVGVAHMETAAAEEHEVLPDPVTDFDIGVLAGKLQASYPV